MNQFFQFNRKILTIISLAILCTLTFGCSGDDEFFIDLSGQANYPPSFRSGAIGELVPVANAPVSVLDLTRSADDRVIATGETDSNGNYLAFIPFRSAIAIVVFGDVRVSGLIDAQEDTSKNFDGITDVACEAGVTAVNDGSITPDQLTNSRIANLEAGADLVLKQTTVDFTDSDGSRSAAVIRVRQITNDGANPPILE